MFDEPSNLHSTSMGSYKRVDVITEQKTKRGRGEGGKEIKFNWIFLVYDERKAESVRRHREETEKMLILLKTMTLIETLSAFGFFQNEKT